MSRLFFEGIRQSSRSLTEAKREAQFATAGPQKPSAAAKRRLRNEQIKLAMQVLMTFAAFSAGFYLAMKGDGDAAKFGSGLMGTAVGYWLR